MSKWSYKFVLSGCIKPGEWCALEDDEQKLTPVLMREHLARLGDQGWELVAVVQVDRFNGYGNNLLKHVLKKKNDAHVTDL